MTDPLLAEIQEDLLRERYAKFWETYRVLIVGTALLVVLATAGVTAWRQHRQSIEEKATGALMQILREADKDKRIGELAGLADKARGETPGALALLHQAALLGEAGKKEEALKVYDRLAADDHAEPQFRQLADLLAVQMQIDSGDPATLADRLKPLMDNSPWMFEARELAALLAIRQKDKAKSIDLLTEVEQDARAPERMRTRVRELARYYAQ